MTKQKTFLVDTFAEFSVLSNKLFQGNRYKDYNIILLARNGITYNPIATQDDFPFQNHVDWVH